MDSKTDRPIIETATEARAGVTPHVARYVLLISLLLVIAAFATLLIVFR